MRFSSGDEQSESCIRLHQLIDELIPPLRVLHQQLLGKYAMTRALYIQERQAAARAAQEAKLEHDAWQRREERRQQSAAKERKQQQRLQARRRRVASRRAATEQKAREEAERAVAREAEHQIRSKMRQQVFETSQVSGSEMETNGMSPVASSAPNNSSTRANIPVYVDSEDDRVDVESEDCTLKRSKEFDMIARAGVLYTSEALGTELDSDGQDRPHRNCKKISMSNTQVPPSLFSPNNIKKVVTLDYGLDGKLISGHVEMRRTLTPPAWIRSDPGSMLQGIRSWPSINWSYTK